MVFWSHWEGRYYSECASTKCTAPEQEDPQFFSGCMWNSICTIVRTEEQDWIFKAIFPLIWYPLIFKKNPINPTQLICVKFNLKFFKLCLIFNCVGDNFCRCSLTCLGNFFGGGQQSVPWSSTRERKQSSCVLDFVTFPCNHSTFQRQPMAHSLGAWVTHPQGKRNRNPI